jgi:hypothetical protein
MGMAGVSVKGGAIWLGGTGDSIAGFTGREGPRSFLSFSAGHYLSGAVGVDC